MKEEKNKIKRHSKKKKHVVISNRLEREKMGQGRQQNNNSQGRTCPAGEQLQEETDRPRLAEQKPDETVKLELMEIHTSVGENWKQQLPPLPNRQLLPNRHPSQAPPAMGHISKSLGTGDSQKKSDIEVDDCLTLPSLGVALVSV